MLSKYGLLLVIAIVLIGTVAGLALGPKADNITIQAMPSGDWDCTWPVGSELKDCRQFTKVR